MAAATRELRTRRATLVNEARRLSERATAENRELRSDEHQQFDRIMAAVDKQGETIRRREQLDQADAEYRSFEAGRRVGDGGFGSAASQRSAFATWCKSGEVRSGLQSPERRDTIIGTDAKGGYLVAPLQISSQILKTIDADIYMKSICAVETVKEAKKLGIRKMSTRMAVSDWTTEVQAATEDTTMAFTIRELEPYLLSKLAKVSLRMMLASGDAGQIVIDELTYAQAATQERAFLTGSGSGQPLGIFTADAAGISTGRDVSSGNTTTAVTADGLINAKYSLKAAHLLSPATRWFMHLDLVKQIRKLKVSTTGGNDLEYLWQPGLTEGDPDKILDIPYHMSEFAPNTFTTGLYVAVLGNFRYYWIAQCGDVTIQRLDELYAPTGEVGFIGRIWVDGAPALEEAFARVKLA